MSNLTPRNSYGLTTFSTPASEGLISSILDAIPMALAKPIIEYKRITEQADVIKKSIDAKLKLQTEIMKTMRELAAKGQLTPEITQYLFAVFNQTLMQYPL